MSHTIPAEFHGIPLSVIDHAGRRWLTSEQVGRALGYAEANAAQGIRNLYIRHADEFTDSDTCQLKLSWQGQMREMRVFSDTGCVLLGMFANTPRAKDFRIWAKTVLAGQAPAPAPTPVSLPGGGRLLVTRRVERLALELFVAGQSLADIGRALGISRATVSLVVHAKYQFSPAAGEPECPPALIAAVAARHLAVEQERLADYHQRLSNRLRHTACNRPLAEALDHVGRQLQQPPARAMLSTPAKEV
ncbi:hypothetical protein [Pseudothauera rhizosphaerae]|uniref:Bro-N domain-containing protein n=1 Tax=Pseudothauera rhizosphaerae TaxID=2565932 RepID=A0A4S4AR56_9RHOO|nr:hypothetical protein [Pseudothauera rhizosphaerae]THF60926.1 hypothetical protein E6O51_11905 [Pseudothauera rhizosphaerae]